MAPTRCAKRLRGASYDVIAGAGHDVSAEAPAQTAERVLEAVGAFAVSRLG